VGVSKLRAFVLLDTEICVYVVREASSTALPLVKLCAGRSGMLQSCACDLLVVNPSWTLVGQVPTLALRLVRDFAVCTMHCSAVHGIGST
jgi:hypothetical protein